MTQSLAELAAGASLARLVKACEARVASRQWASYDLDSPEPYYFERNQYSCGKKLAKQPASKSDAKLYGYDAEGRVARLRSWSGFLESWDEEELFVPADDRVVVGYRFRCDGTLMNVHRYTQDAQGRLLLHEVYFARAKRTATQRFVWRAGLLVEVKVKNWGSSWALTWDKHGELVAISTVEAGRKDIVVYRRPAKSESLPKLLEVIYDRLLEVIPRVAARLKPKSPAYALLIVLDEEEWRYSLPPSIVLGFEEDRERLRASDPENLRELLWNASEVPSFDGTKLELRDVRLTKAAERANQHFWLSGTQGKGKTLMRRLARELQSLDWKSLRAVTDDFVVYVTAVEGDGWRHVRRDAPAVVKKRLIARGEI